MASRNIEYIRSIPLSNLLEPVDLDVILRERVDALKALLPAWSGSPDSPAYKIQEMGAMREFLLRQLVNQTVRNSFPPYATKSHLTILAAGRNIAREDLDDDELLLTLINKINNNPGTEYGLNALARSSSVTVADATIEFSADKRTSTVYALGPGQRDLTVDEQAILLLWMNRSDHTILDVTAVIGDVVRTPLVINATLNYYPDLISEDILLAFARTAVYEWIDENSLLGNTIYQDAIRGPLRVGGVGFIDIASPADASYDGAKSTIYTFKKEDVDDGVRLSAMAIV